MTATITPLSLVLLRVDVPALEKLLDEFTKLTDEEFHLGLVAVTLMRNTARRGSHMAEHAAEYRALAGRIDEAEAKIMKQRLQS